MEEIKKLNIKIGALQRSVNYLVAHLSACANERHEALLAERRKELMVARGKRTKLANKLAV